jgi:hypothetical protein
VARSYYGEVVFARDPSYDYYIDVIPRWAPANADASTAAWATAARAALGGVGHEDAALTLSTVARHLPAPQP